MAVRRRAAVHVTLLAFAAVALAGCLGGAGPDGPIDTAASGPGIAVQPGVEDPFRFEVKVVEEHADGAPVEGATVVFFRNRRLDSPDDGYYVTDEEIPRDGVLDLTASHAFEVQAVGRTGPDGRVVGLIDSDPNRARSSVAVGGVPGFTDEVVLIAWPDANPIRADVRDPSEFWTSHEPPLVIPLYERQKELGLTGTMQTDASTDFAAPDGVGKDTVWRPVAVDLGPGSQGYAGRVIDLDLTLAWNNTPTEYGELHLVARVPGHGTVEGGDDLETPVRGAMAERLEWASESSFSPRAQDLLAGPATDTAVVAPDGLEWTVTGTARFKGANVVLPAVP